MRNANCHTCKQPICIAKERESDEEREFSIWLVGRAK